MLRTSILLLLCASLSWAAIPLQGVSWRGELRKVLRGDDAGTMDLKDLEGIPGIYAVGVAAGLDGEITVLNGKPHLAQVRGQEIITSSTFTVSAAFLAWSQVRDWQSSDPLLMGAETGKQLARVIRKTAVTFGVDVDRPFPFLLHGTAPLVEYHVTVPRQENAPEGNPKRHEVRRFRAENERVTIIGFHSRDHEGILTHRGSTLHMHVVTEKGLSGHVDNLVTSPELLIRFPFR